MTTSITGKYSGPWWVEWDGRDAIRCETFADLMSRIDELHASAREVPRLTRVSPKSPGPRLTFGLGQPHSFLSWEATDLGAEFVSLGDESAEGRIEWTWLNRPSRVPTKYHIPFAAVREAVLWFAEKLEMAPFVRWTR